MADEKKLPQAQIKRVVIEGSMPVTDTPGDSNRLAKEYYESLLIKMQFLDATAGNTSCSYFGHEFSAPIAVSALSHLGNNKDGKLRLAEIAKATAELNLLDFMGAGDMSELDEVIATGAKVVKIIKPYKDHDLIFGEMEYAEKAGAFAVGMDIDHIYYMNNYAAVDGIPLYDVKAEELASYIKASKLPFIVKGVLSAEDAKKSIEAGADGLFLSHHHGMYKFMTPPAMMLPDIVKVVKESGKDVKIFIDGNIENSYSVFKALALGADCAAIGRPLMPEVQKGGADAVKAWLEKMCKELPYIMARSCCNTVEDITIDHLIKAEHRF